jgi:predicted esterase
MSGVGLLLLTLILVIPAEEIPAARGKRAPIEEMRRFLLDPNDRNAEALGDLAPDEIPGVVARALASVPRPEAKSGKILVGEDYYLYELPEGYDPSRPWPLIVSLHGNPPRHCERVHERYWRGEASAHGFILVSPNFDGGRWHRPEGEERFFKLFKEAVVHFRVDPERIFVGGYSAGATGAWNLASNFSDLFAGAVVRCGKRRFPDEQFGNLADTGIFLIHAARDEKCPVEAAREAVRLMTARGVDHRYVEYPGGHDFYWQSNRDVLEYFAGLIHRTPKGFAFTGSFAQEHRLLGFISLLGDRHVVTGEWNEEGGRVHVKPSESVAHLDLYFSNEMVVFGRPVPVTVNGTELTVTPRRSVEAFVRAWRLHPFFDPEAPGRLFLGTCRVIKDGAILNQAECL